MEKKQQKHLAGAAVIVMASLILSRITGFFRTSLIPNMFPDLHQTDALYYSFTITNFMYNLLVGGAISAALIPVLSSYIVKKDEKEGWKAVGTFINCIFMLILILSILGIIFAPHIVALTAPKFPQGQKELTVSLMRILFPSVSFIMLAGIVGGVLNSYQRFAAAAFGPSVYNLGCALSIFFLSPWGIKVATTGIMISAFIYFLFQLSFALKNFKYFRFRLYLKHPGFIRFTKLAIPSLIASSVVQINLVITTFFIGMLTLGSVTAYNNATDTWQLPYGIFAMGIGMAMLPTMCEKAALGDMNGFKELLLKSIKIILFFTIPSAVALLVLRVPIINVIFKFSDHINIPLTGNLLIFFTIALIAQSFLAIINRSFYALNDTKTPLYVGIITVVTNTAFCYIAYMISMKNPSFKVYGYDAAGIALAYSLSSAMNAIILVYLLNKKINGIALRNIGGFLMKAVPAALMMGGVLFVANIWVPVDYYSRVFSVRIKLIEVFWVMVLIGGGVSVYAVATLQLKMEEAVYAKDLLFSKVPFLKKIFA